MKLYAMSDIHGCLAEFEDALELVLDHLEGPDTMLVLLGDYIHGGPDGRKVLDRIMSLQENYGRDRVVTLLGNHEEMVLRGESTVDYMTRKFLEEPIHDDEDDKYIAWMEELPRYYVEGNSIFVHAGIDEEAGDMWEWSTDDWTLTWRFPATTGRIPGLDAKVVAGHVYTSQVAGNPHFHGIYYDGASHYYIDGDVLTSGYIPVLLVDTKEDSYYRVTQGGTWKIEPYEELDY